MRVTVLGAGSWGTTVASLSAGRNPTLLWARNPDVAAAVNDKHENPAYLAGFTLPESLRATSDLGEAVSDAEVLVVGVPSHGFRAVLEEAAPHVPHWIPVVSLTKGFEAGTLFRMTEVIRDVLPGRVAAALSGPNLAKEIMAGNAAASVIATEDLAVAGELQRVLSRGLFRVYTNHDVVGCEVGGALKNVIAIATGIAQGLSVGDNTRAAVISRGLAELTRLGVAMGAEPATMAGLAGMGDLIATCISPLSRNRQVGERLGKGESIDDILASMSMVAEGVKTAHVVMDLAARHGVDLPICAEIRRVVSGEVSAPVAYRGLMARAPAGHESGPV
ncbi:MAG: glycerol-3-phosphate dehydrogenase [Actinomycetota bacterium]|jgi:glycerol-3-phosphate dehydrogenase (NAD(P)+)|nr:glycerol-3-phosphate dehydrogenase [Actinomycetota bacterium]MDQ1503064.1 glycerol-3-phosphate dehydrogenase [Actinomycetota bacterium]